ncbi:MAG TPA: SAM-dependent chlorinase/fluorinase, partial [Thermodesulfovibrionales bacterium]|nr:SAM-dependent chlorinase/fluorinase [Thermodesulfovibrionales bacterium]
MEQRLIITLTTDFGYKDPFAGIIKGVILGINPTANIVDLTHGISPQNIMQAAFAIEASFQYFPQKSVNVVVVDPGVGSVRRPIIVAADNRYFVGPDNGIFTRLYASAESFEVVHVTAEHYFLPSRSSTFHGRDVFAPVAGWLSRGVDILNFGELIADFVTIPIPAPASPSDNIIEGEVVYIDTFGNLTTNIHHLRMDEMALTNGDKKHKVLVRGREAPLKGFYSEPKDRGLYSLVNSFGYLELFVNSGNAASEFG